MANVNNITSNSYSSSTSSLYGNRNVLTGLASGMDTEAMIQNSVAGYQTKITELEQSTTKLEWKQDAYRELIDQMYSINQKYMSYTSKANLSSNSFFNNAITTASQGTNAAAISATGTAKSDIQINAVTQLATSARYSIDADALGIAAASSPKGEKINWSLSEMVGQVKGTMTLKYSNQSIDLKFTDKDTFDIEDGDTDEQKIEKLRKAIEDKLGEVDIKAGNSTVKARALIDVRVETTKDDNGNPTSYKFIFEENSTHPDKSGSNVYIDSVSGNIKDTLHATKPASTENKDKFANNNFVLSNADGLVKTPSVADYVSGKTVDITLDGVTKQIKLGDLKEPDLSSYDATIAEKKAAMDALTSGSDDWWFARTAYLEAEQAKTDAFKSSLNEQLKSDLQTSIDKQFGKGKVTVNITDGALDFSVTEGSGSTLKVTSEVGEKLGLGSGGVSNYFNTSKTLGNLLTADWLDKNARIKADPSEIVEKVVKTANTWYKDENGQRVNAAGSRIDSDGNIMYQKGAGGVRAIKDDPNDEDRITGYVDANEAKVDEEGYLLNAEGNRMVLLGTGETTEVNEEEVTVRYDAKGNRVNDEGYLVDDKGKYIYGLEINGAKITGLTENTTLESLINSINSNADAGVKVSYSNLTSQFVFTATETGESGKISFDNPLAKKLFTANNAPEQVTLEKFFGDSISWDENGNATIRFFGAGTSYKSLGELNKNMTVDTLIEKIEGLSPNYQGLISYNEDTGTYSVTDELNPNGYGFRQKDADEGFDLTPLLNKLESGVREAGKDAVIDATVNGKQLTLTRSSNVVDMDGLSVTLKDEFSAYDTDGKLVKADAVTFKTSSNADDIVAVVKDFVDDVNKLMNDVHSAFATQPAEKNSSKHTKYEPLTEEDKNGMSESAINAYEEKAKQGLLFGDTDLSSLYNKLRDVIQSFGADRAAMESIGLSTTYSNGVTTISFNESKMRDALSSDPDKVRSVFTKTKEGGASTNGLMASLKATINTYASTSIATPGILVRKAGTKLSSLSLLNNNLQKQIDNVNNQIESWQTKLSSKIDYYTKQFTALEKLMSTMNNQSSMLADLMGY